MKLAIIGGGPAGLRAAEVAAQAGIPTTLFDAKASVGRKFLVAGKGGLNLTNAESRERFITRYSSGPWESLLQEGDPEALRQWAASLGVTTFDASTGRVYPREMKAAPLLRRWVHRLRELGVEFAMHHRLTGLRRGDRWSVDFDTGAGPRTIEADAVILALGGGSWPETGSDGTWTSVLGMLDIDIAPLEAANCGWNVAWPEAVLREAEGRPLKSIRVSAGETDCLGELVVTRYGLEGGPIYQLGPVLRGMKQPCVAIDFKPQTTAEALAGKLAPAERVALLEALRVWKLGPAAGALLRGYSGCPALARPADYAAAVKNCEIPLVKARPIEEAISSAGGIRWSELTDTLMLRKWPGLFAAGEMIDWEAPTGGYLIQGCFATGTRAGRAAVEWLRLG